MVEKLDKSLFSASIISVFAVRILENQSMSPILNRCSNLEQTHHQATEQSVGEELKLENTVVLHMIRIRQPVNIIGPVELCLWTVCRQKTGE